MHPFLQYTLATFCFLIGLCRLLGAFTEPERPYSFGEDFFPGVVGILLAFWVANV